MQKKSPNSEYGIAQDFKKIQSMVSLNDVQVECLIQVLKDVQEVQQAIELACRKDHLETPSVWIAGGALRDILLMPEPKIKDVDIYMMPPYSWYENFVNSKIPESLERVLKECMGKKGGSMVSHKQKMKEEQIDSYLSHAILDVIKLKSEKQHYDIELIVTPNEPDAFIFESFDFSICKCAFRMPAMRGSLAWNVSAWTGLVLEHLRKEKLSEENRQAKKWTKMFEQDGLWCVGENFWDHIEQKKIVFEGQSYRPDQVAYSLTNHLPRIWEKYPQYQLGVDVHCQVRWEDWGEEGVKVQKLYTAISEEKTLSDVLSRVSMGRNSSQNTKTRVRVL